MPINHGLVDIAAHELCSLLGLPPTGESKEPGFVGDYHINWARHEIEKAVAIREAIRFATGA